MWALTYIVPVIIASATIFVKNSLLKYCQWVFQDEIIEAIMSANCSDREAIHDVWFGQCLHKNFRRTQTVLLPNSFIDDIVHNKHHAMLLDIGIVNHFVHQVPHNTELAKHAHERERERERESESAMENAS